ncbi:C40 family peptidase [Sanguibacter hominis ATCC BAA-789]|uniref:C40 family peptidase n=1 Tax=Sanguibacter hominis ATCC BAA-789 TaxID=1312740 RepID=A0A9X5FD36_9MICO|nr:C40 family peptidase [Sanguibacter hominis ATCC BAA-789]
MPRKLSAKKHTIRAVFRPSAQTAATVAPGRDSLKVRVISEGAQIAKIAKQYVGVRYRSGGGSPSGFDCSGFTSYVYKKAGIAKLPRSSAAQRHSGKTVSRSKARAGDLIWTRGHVAIYLGKGKQIDAPRPGKTIQVRSIWQSNPTFIRV